MGHVYNRSFYPGRFQPFHKGHLYAIEYVLSFSREVIIGVTAAQFSFLRDNPFTAGERIEMVKLALGSKYERCYVVPLDNVTNNAEWLAYVEARVPNFGAVFTNNLLVKMLARRRGYKVHSIPFKNREMLEGRRIRDLMAKGSQWRKFVPEPVVKFLERIEGEERIKNLYRVEEIPLP